MNVAVGVILTCKMTVSEVLYWTVVGPVGYNKPAQSINVAYIKRSRLVFVYDRCRLPCTLMTVFPVAST